MVLVVRADFYGLMAELPGLGARAGGATVLVGSPTETDLRVIVTEPARRVGLEVEPALVERVLDDVREQPGALPLLSAALVRTFDNRDGSTLTVAGYLAGGGVEGALEATAEEVYDALDDDARSAARILLVRLAAREGGRWVRRPLPRREAERPDDPAGKRAVAALAHRRLLVIGADRVEVAHEALLTGWPRLHGWLEERSLSAELAEHLRTASLGWEGSGTPRRGPVPRAPSPGRLGLARRPPGRRVAAGVGVPDGGSGQRRRGARRGAPAGRRRGARAASAAGRRRVPSRQPWSWCWSLAWLRSASAGPPTRRR